jgi:hypothetical protein
MSDAVIVIDTSEIRAGRLEEVQRAVRDLARFVDEDEPRTMAYNVYFDDAGTRMTVVQIHPDSASMEYHMKVSGPAFRQFTGMLRLLTMDVYGDPSDDLLALLRSKARMLGAEEVAVHRHYAGFIRGQGA